MNITQKKSFKIKLLAMCLIMAMIASHVGKVMASSTGEVTTTVSDYSQLLSAMVYAEDGDVIGIDGTITFSGYHSVGYADKHITLRRMTSSSYFNIGSESIFQNLTFDGGGISAANAYVFTSANVTFQNVTFQNSITNTANGGAVYVLNYVVSFNNCTFDSNTAVQGGHIYTANTANVTIENCTMKNGHAISDGGAIKNASSTSTCNVTSSIITGNSAGDFGGGLSNKGNMKIIGSKVFDNTAPNGTDIANAAYGNLNLTDSIESLVELFKDDGIIPTAWINDYDGNTSIDPDINPTGTNSLLKLEYDIPPTAVTLAPSSLGSAGNAKITGLESGKWYKVIVDGVINYVKSDGSMTIAESEAGTLTGTEIVNLTNGTTYKVVEYVPVEPTPTIEPTPTPTPDPVEPTGEPDPTTDPTPSPTETPVDEVTPSPTPIVVEPTPSPSPTPTPIVTPIEDIEPTPTPTPTPIETPIPTPTPTPNTGGSHSSYYPIDKPVVETKTPAVLSSGKAVLDTTKTEYLLGYTDGLMGNKDTVTRAQLAQIVYKLLTPESVIAVYSEKNNFKDVAADDWYNEAVSTIAKAGLIVSGENGKFNPDKNVTWGEMVTILAKFADPNSKRKIITKHWAKDALNTAISYEWIDYNDQFNPDGEVTSVEMLNFINAMFTWTIQ